MRTIHDGHRAAHPDSTGASRERLQALAAALGSVLVGKEAQIELVLICLLAGGHVLLEDAPGVGKTMLARALARAIRGDFKRIQCTADLLPSDVTGVTTYDTVSREFKLHQGPVFCQILLVDEINRASPRTQSALLESMTEGTVTLDGVPYPLPEPHFVIATQNRLDVHGTFPLPMAQLDRFMMRLSMGYPTLEEEVQLMLDRRRVDPLDDLAPWGDIDDLRAGQRAVLEVHVSPDLVRYIALLVSRTRRDERFGVPASPRASLALLRAGQARALLKGRDHVLPDDIAELFLPVVAHRVGRLDALAGDPIDEALLRELLESTPVPL